MVILTLCQIFENNGTVMIAIIIQPLSNSVELLIDNICSMVCHKQYDLVLK